MNAEQAALASEIAKLSGAIDSRRREADAPRTVRGASSVSALRGRGVRARGRGTTGRAARGRFSGPPLAARASRHRSVVFPHAPPGDGMHQGAADTAHADGVQAQWVKRTSSSSVALVNAAVYQPSTPAREDAAGAHAHGNAHARPKVPRRPHDARREVIVDGVVFVFDGSGTKLVKKSTLPDDGASRSSADVRAGEGEGGGPVRMAAAAHDAAAQTTRGSLDTGTPLFTSVDGQKFIRTKRGNLISHALVAERLAAREKRARIQHLAAAGQQIGARQRMGRGGGRRGGRRAMGGRGWVDGRGGTGGTGRAGRRGSVVPARLVPTTDTLYVRDDSGAPDGEERAPMRQYAVDVAEPTESVWNAPGSSRAFAQQRDYIGLDDAGSAASDDDEAASETFASVSSDDGAPLVDADELASDEEIERSLLPW
ncbi:hypothetical protein MSPP1_001541 [Malassezia sp. CBS 17886]|nr:hypothetical protein MSPP1_001541 [Malassezia sp. CBS 17886]